MNTYQTALQEVIETQGRKAVWVARSLTPPVDASTITRWCNGERPIPPERVIQLAELLDVEPDVIRGVAA